MSSNRRHAGGMKSAMENLKKIDERIARGDGPHIDVLSRLRALQRCVERCKDYGFGQDIWQAAADEIETLRLRNMTRG